MTFVKQYSSPVCPGPYQENSCLERAVKSSVKGRKTTTQELEEDESRHQCAAAWMVIPSVQCKLRKRIMQKCG
ncbi:hypothetical protein EK904_008046 [Melospiza melodia maxima]|nr:hypothetical protein EK904_008046 [Melospiza melodia maxima]